MSLQVKPGQQIKASQYNALAASVSQSIGATDTPFRSTGQGMIVNGGNAPYQSKAKYQNDKLFECRIGSGKVPQKFTRAGQDFYGTFVNVANFLNTSIYSAQRIDPRSTPTVVQVVEALYVQDPTAGENQVKLVGFEVASQNKTPAEVGFNDCSNIWCPVSQMKWDDQKKYFVGGSVYLRLIQLFSWDEPETHGMVVMIIDDGSISSAEDLKTAIIAATGYNPVTQIDQMRSLRQIQLFSTRTAITEANDKPLATPVQFFDGTFTVGNDPDSDISNVSYLQSIEKTNIEQLGLSGYAGEIRGSHCYSLYHFGQLSSDIDFKIPWKSPSLSSFDVLLRLKLPHPKGYEDRAYAQLMYASLSSFAPDDIEVDSNLPPVLLSSIQIKEDDNGVKYHQLYNFQNPGMGEQPLSALSGIEFVVRDAKTLAGNGKIVNYLDLQGFSNSIKTTIINDVNLSTVTVDSNIPALLLSSVQDMTLQDGTKYHQLYNFQNPGMGDMPISALSGIEMVVRDAKTTNNNGKIVNYLDLQGFSNSIKTTVIDDIKLSSGTVDSELPALHLSSIQDMRDSDDKQYHQLFNFQNEALDTFQISDCNDFDFVVRDKKTMPAQGGQGDIVNYINLSSFINQLSTVISGGGGGAYWHQGGDSQTCFGTEIKIGNVLIYETTV